jgi:tetratricopeptide (TPR) repeat protein
LQTLALGLMVRRPPPNLVTEGPDLSFRRIELRPESDGASLAAGEVERALKSVKGLLREEPEWWSYADSKRWLHFRLRVLSEKRKKTKNVIRIDMRIPNRFRHDDGDADYIALASALVDPIGWRVRDPRSQRWLDKSLGERARAAREAEKFDESVRLFQRALERQPKNDDLWYELGHVQLHSLEDLDGAEKSFDRVLELDPQSSAGWFQRAYLLDERKLYDQALVAYEKSIGLDPGDPMTFNNKAYVLNHLARHEEALVCCDKAISMDATDAFYLYNKACTFCWMGDKEHTLEWLGKTFALDASYRELAPKEIELKPFWGDPDFRKLCEAG